MSIEISPPSQTLMTPEALIYGINCIIHTSISVDPARIALDFALGRKRAPIQWFLSFQERF
jgi:hypothetical protein